MQKVKLLKCIVSKKMKIFLFYVSSKFDRMYLVSQNYFFLIIFFNFERLIDESNGIIDFKFFLK